MKRELMKGSRELQKRFMWIFYERLKLESVVIA